jgi:hypothetical protein
MGDSRGNYRVVTQRCAIGQDARIAELAPLGGGPGVTRTPNPRIRNPMLYPLELRALANVFISLLARLHRRLCKNCTCLKSSGQLGRRTSTFHHAHLDVALRRDAHIAVTHGSAESPDRRFPVPLNCSPDPFDKRATVPFADLPFLPLAQRFGRRYCSDRLDLRANWGTTMKNRLSTRK